MLSLSQDRSYGWVENFSFACLLTLQQADWAGSCCHDREILEAFLDQMAGYPLVMTNIAIENTTFLVDLPI